MPPLSSFAKPSATSQPSLSSFAKPATPSATQAQPQSLSESIWSGLAGVGGQVAQAAQSGVSQIQQGLSQGQNGSSIANPIEGALKVGAGVVNTLSSPLAPITAPIGTAVNAIADKVSDIPAVQKFAQSPAGNVASHIAEDVGNASTIAGAVGGAMEAPKVPESISNGATAVKDTVAGAAAKVADKVPDKNAVISSLTNIPKPVFERLDDPTHAANVHTYLQSIDEGRNPAADLASKVGAKINDVETQSQATFKDQARAFTDSGEKFDVASRINQIESAVKEFSPGYDIKFDQVRKTDGTLGGFKLVKGAQSPFSSTQIGYLNSMINDIRNAKDLNADKVLALDKKLGTYYNLVDDSNGPTPYHALVMQIKAASEKEIADTLPSGLRTAYQNYARVQNLKSDFGNKLVDAQGHPKDTAPSFIANLMGKNKENVQAKVSGYSDLLGTDVTKEAQAISDAQKLHQTEAPTGGRVSDILKASVFGGGGAAAGAMVAGPAGAVVGTGLGAAIGKRITSPRMNANRLISKTLSKIKK